MASNFERLPPITRKLAERFETGVMDIHARLDDGDGMTGELILQDELTLMAEAYAAAISRLEIKFDKLAELCGYDIQLIADNET
jgi:hypothetical protein